MKIAIVTGASSGMGREFVYALDREGKYEEIWVIARRADRLESLKTECKTAIRPIALDLGKAESFDEMKPRAGCGAGARDVAGILWDLGFEQDDVDGFHRYSSFQGHYHQYTALFLPAQDEF